MKTTPTRGSQRLPDDFEGPLPGPAPIRTKPSKRIPIDKLDLGIRFVEPDYSTNNGGYKPVKSVDPRWAAGMIALSDIMVMSRPERMNLHQARGLMHHDKTLAAAGVEAEIDGRHLVLNYDADRITEAEVRAVAQKKLKGWPGLKQVQYLPFATIQG